MIAFRISLLHSGTGYPTGWLHSDWIPDPTVVISAFLIAAAYLLFTGSMNQRRPDAADRPVTRKQRILFVSGCVAFLIALGQPLDDWSDNYLLTAHMLQHLILMFAVAPLWMLGTPAWMLEPLTRVRVIDRLGYLLTRPVSAFILGNAIMVLWHIPGVYNAALDHEPLHVLQHGMFLAGAILAWWPVIGPLPAWPKLPSPVNCLYLFVYSIPGGILGAFITLGDVPFYDFYGNVPRIFGISLEVDQQLAGTMMWVGSSSLYLLWITFLFFQWAGREDEADRSSSVPVTTRTSSGVAAP